MKMLSIGQRLNDRVAKLKRDFNFSPRQVWLSSVEFQALNKQFSNMLRFSTEGSDKTDVIFYNGVTFKELK